MPVRLKKALSQLYASVRGEKSYKIVIIRPLISV